MRDIFYISLLLTLGCKNESKPADKITATDSITHIESVNKIGKSKYYTARDTVFIGTEAGDTLSYTKNEFNEIIDNHPELANIEYVQNPDLLYYTLGQSKGFGSEAGQDTYYVLYAYFLKQKNGDAKYAEQRKKLIALYSNINSLFDQLEYGGTYFGHQYSRILGYAEYSVYLLIEKEKRISKTYDITKEKELYIHSLKQIIKDQSSIDFNTLGKEKEKRNKELNKIVDEIDTLITDIFYLKRVQAFHYENYEYY